MAKVKAKTKTAKRVSVKTAKRKSGVALLTEKDLDGLKAGIMAFEFAADQPEDCKSTDDSGAHSCGGG